MEGDKFALTTDHRSRTTQVVLTGVTRGGTVRTSPESRASRHDQMSTPLIGLYIATSPLETSCISLRVAPGRWLALSCKAAIGDVTKWDEVRRSGREQWTEKEA